MELAGVVAMHGGLSPELLKYVFVKGQETSEQQPGKTTFCVFDRSSSAIVPETATAEPEVQPTEAVPEKPTPEVSAVKQTSITDFFSPRATTHLADVPASSVAQSRDVVGGLAPPFITPGPSVKLAEVPAAFEVQSGYRVEDRFDHTRPLFEGDTSPAEVSREKTIDELKRFRRYSQPSIAATWNDRTVSSPSKNEALPETPAEQLSSSFHELPFDNLSSPAELAGSDPFSNLPVGDAEADDTQLGIEKYWIEKDGERLAVIADLEKTMTEMKGELTNTATAFQMASNANQKLQAELKYKKTSLSRMEENMNDLAHNLDAAEMVNEKLEKDLAQSQVDRKHQSDRAEETLKTLQAQPSKRIIADILKAKTESEDRFIIRQGEMESEINFLESQLEERRHSVDRLTAILSRVADFDRWGEVEREIEELRKRADKLPEELQAARLECDKWTKKHNTVWQKHEEILLKKASLEEELRNLKDFDLGVIRDLKRRLNEEVAIPKRGLRKCLKQVFERLVRCSLCLERNGYLPFGEKHRAIYERVSELSGKDYQQPLMEYYNEHDICEEFDFGEIGESVYEDGEAYSLDNGDHLNNKDRLNDGHHLSNGDQAEKKESGLQANDHDPDERPFSPAAKTHNSPPVVPAPVLVTKEEENGVAASQMKLEVQETQGQSHNSASPAPIFRSTEPSASAGSNGPDSGTTFDFGFSKDPPPSFFAKFTSNPKPKSDEKAAIFTSYATQQSAEVQAPASEQPKAKNCEEAIEGQKKAAPGIEKAATFSPQLQDFNFGGNSSPVTFSASSSSFPARDPQPAPTWTFPYKAQDSPLMTVEPKEEVESAEGENSGDEFEAPKGKAAEQKISPWEEPSQEEGVEIGTVTAESSQEKDLKNELFQETTVLGEQTATESSPSPASRSEKRAAKKAQEKVAKKAEAEAKNAKANASRRVQQALMSG